MNDSDKQIVTVRVSNHQLFGLVVELPDKRKGIVRLREISWSIEERLHWKKLFPVGYETKACILREDKKQYPELSLRIVQNDPWENIFKFFRVGQIVDGVVTGVKGYGAFIEIAQGLTGLLHYSELPDHVKKDPIELFWPGDHVRVYITKLDAKSRRISLSLKRVVNNRSKRPANELTFSYSSMPKQPGKLLSKSSQMELLAQKGPLRILVVEDDLEQLSALSAWLNHSGQVVTPVESAEDGLNSFEREPHDIVIVDYGLSGMSGIEFTQKVLELSPSTRCILSTDWARVEEHFSEIDRLRTCGVHLLIKPLLPEDLLDALLEDSTEGLASNPSLISSQTDWLERVKLYSQYDAVFSVLEESRKATQFDTAIFFELDPTSRSVKIIAKRGSLETYTQAIDSLIHSPVRDVAEDGDLVVMPNIDPNTPPRRFNYLQSYIKFVACLGTPIPGQFSSRYCLFLFHNYSRDITDFHVGYIRAAAMALSGILEKKALQEHAAKLQKVALMGQMASNLIHEVSHHLNPLNFALESLGEDLKIAFNTHNSNIEQNSLLVQNTFDKVQLSASDLTKTMRLFRRVLISGKDEIIRLDSLIQETLLLLRETARISKVTFSIDEREGMIIFRSQVTLLQQVLLNLILNAIEQISGLSSDGGWVVIKSDLVHPSTGSSILRILIQDNGPGIHWRYWKKSLRPASRLPKVGTV